MRAEVAEKHKAVLDDLEKENHVRNDFLTRFKKLGIEFDESKDLTKQV